MKFEIRRTQSPSRAARTALALSALAVSVAAIFVAGCGEKKDKATQVVAKVNGDEITVLQLNFALQQQRGLRPEQMDAASKAMLERLIDQQLAVQKAEKDKLDRDPRVMQALEAARREVLTRFYIEQVAEKAGKPTADDVKKYYDSKPANYAERRIYTIQKVDATVDRAKVPDLVTRLQAARTPAEVGEYLKSQNIKFNVGQSQQPAESLGPLADKLAALKEGQTLALPQAFGVTALTVLSSQAAPVTLEQAKGQIEQQLANERRREAVQGAGKALRESAKIEYLGKFAPGAASAPAAVAVPLPNVPSSPGTSPASAAASSATASSAGAAASSAGMDAATLKKGLGLK